MQGIGRMAIIAESTALVLAVAAVAAVMVVTLLVSAAVAGAAQTPVISWSPIILPRTYEYGTLTAGRSVSQTFTLANSSGSATSALTISLTGSGVHHHRRCCTHPPSLGPGKSCTFTVTYAPAAVSEHNTGTPTATARKAAANASLTLRGGQRQHGDSDQPG
jgi:hypothetical protein